MEEIIELAKEAEERKDEIESLRNIPIDIIDRVKRNGIIKSWVAKEFGGAQNNIEQVADQLQRISYHNGSLAWIIGVTGCTSLFSGFLNKALAEKLFISPDCMIGGFAGPEGVAHKVEGGLMVTGHWHWGSGVTLSSHIVGGVRIVDKDRVISSGVVFLHPSQVSFHDNWKVLGLKGTHSVDYSVNKVFVSNEDWSVFPQSVPYIKGPLYRFSFLGALSISVASVGLGLAQRSYDELLILSQVKQPFGIGKVLAQREFFQIATGRIKAKLCAAQALLRQTISEAWIEAEQGPASDETKANIRMMSTHVTALSKEVIQAAYDLAGGSAVWQDHKFEELLRDINMVSQHGMVNQSNFRTAGAVFLNQHVPQFLL